MPFEQQLFIESHILNAVFGVKMPTSFLFIPIRILSGFLEIVIVE